MSIREFHCDSFDFEGILSSSFLNGDIKTFAGVKTFSLAASLDIFLIPGLQIILGPVVRQAFVKVASVTAVDGTFLVTNLVKLKSIRIENNTAQTYLQGDVIVGPVISHLDYEFTHAIT